MMNTETLIDLPAANPAHPAKYTDALLLTMAQMLKGRRRILDPFGGSMSSVLACIDMGFDIDCYELDPDYYFASKKRIENHVQQLPIFGEPPIINFIH